jgi:RHH-type rel operon transcriptional repressor/antitoxin RelB
MTATAEPTTTITVRIPQTVRHDLEVLARSTGRNRNTLVHEAITRLIETQRWQIAMIEDRLRQADAGDFATDAEMDELWAEFGLEADDDAGETPTRAAS